ncbi:hypothetical protein DPMN_114945 [Dreissena polymorpha]|uniref:Uncharacterized protein n=1 Tax=Dreissena polymorpha TaxID=45954 RepID=A0A9D4KLY1_DREPO|nr:hypothetical protein DPMN_114945 [Dreissena polymorpha]
MCPQLETNGTGDQVNMRPASADVLAVRKHVIATAAGEKVTDNVHTKIFWLAGFKKITKTQERAKCRGTNLITNHHTFHYAGRESNLRIRTRSQHRKDVSTSTRG